MKNTQETERRRNVSNRSVVFRVRVGLLPMMYLLYGSPPEGRIVHCSMSVWLSVQTHPFACTKPLKPLISVHRKQVLTPKLRGLCVAQCYRLDLCLWRRTRMEDLVTGIFGNFCTERGEFSRFWTGIPGGPGGLAPKLPLVLAPGIDRLLWQR